MDMYLLDCTNKVSINPSLRERVFYSARDGMSLTLFALLYEKNDNEIDDLLNTLSVVILNQKINNKLKEMTT